VLQLSYNPYLGKTKKVPQATLEAHCGDQDGCDITIAMRNWASNGATQTQPASYRFHFYYNATTKRWRVSDGGPAGGNTGTDGDGSTTHVINAFDACYFTDGNYIGSANQGDPDVGMSLLYWTAYSSASWPQKLCELVIED
jgi:hypothetical protein